MAENPENPIQPSPEPLRDLLITTPEGRVLLTGLAFSLGYVLWLAVCFVLDPDHAHIFIGMTATEIIFGRAACMTLGYAAKLNSLIVIPICIVLETILVLLVYGMVVLGFRQLVVFKWFRKTLNRINRAAEANKTKIQRYGIIGLFFFVWFPFWMTGPVVGCVIGFFLGLRTWVNLVVVLSATYIAIIGWALFLRHVHGRLSAYSPYGSAILFGIVIGVILIGRHLYKRRHKEEDDKT